MWSDIRDGFSNFWGNRSNLISVSFGIAMISIFTTQYASIKRLEDGLAAANQQVTDLEKQYTDSTLEINKLKGSVGIIDSVINAESKRKQRIMKVKSVIREIIQQDGLATASKLDSVQTSEISTAIIDNCDRFDVPVSLMLGLIRQESAFNPMAVSEDGAQGLTQVMPMTADDIKGWLGRTYYDPFRISHNITFGSYYLSRMLHKFGYNRQHAVWAYNGGPEAVARHISAGSKLYPETIEYEKLVTAYARQYEGMGAN